MKRLAKGSFKTVRGEFRGTPGEIWGFRTVEHAGAAPRVARAFLKSNAELLGLDAELTGLEHQRTVRSVGANHVIFQQRLFGRRVHRAYVTVHLSRQGRVYLTKNRAMPRTSFPPRAEFALTRKDVVARARRALPGRSRNSQLQTVEEMWFPEDRELLPAVRVRLARHRPQEEWIVYVHAKTGAILSKYDNLAKARGRALVFFPNPATAMGGFERLLTDAGKPRRPPLEAYRDVTLYGLKTNGRLEGVRVTTEATARKHRVQRTNREFLLRSHQRGFEEVMAYYHIDSALRYLERLGFRDRRKIFDEPLRVNVNGTAEDDSWYSPWERVLTFGTGDIDDAEDAETILHELGHAIQDAIVPDFGQSEEAAAMGEGFGDYFAASFFADEKPAAYRACVMSWDGLLRGLEEGYEPPALRYLDWAWTYDDFDPQGDEHSNGEIWSAALWDVREALGGETADRLIVESHFQLDGFTTFARGARAIVDADENLHAGLHRGHLREIFKARKIGPV